MRSAALSGGAPVLSAVLRQNGDVYKRQQVIIVDEFTGRLMFGRRYNEGLHQAIEAKEHVEVANESKNIVNMMGLPHGRMKVSVLSSITSGQLPLW